MQKNYHFKFYEVLFSLTLIIVQWCWACSQQLFHWFIPVPWALRLWSD